MKKLLKRNMGLLLAAAAFGGSLRVGAEETNTSAGVTAPSGALEGGTSGRVTAGFRYSDEAQEYYGDVLFPVLGAADSRLFLDLRGTALEDAEQELNAGLVFRQLLSERGLILGANVFYDTRWTELDNTFDQVGVGLEVLSRRVDVRANYYHPLTDEEELSEFSTSEVSSRNESGRRIDATTTSIYKTYEEALGGFDVEAGWWLPFLDRAAPTALFVGYYSFDSDFEADQTGVKFRIESRIHPNLTLDAEWFEDDQLNGTEYFVGARVQVPLHFWNGLRFPAAGGKDAPVRPLEDRMNEMVNRDFRIRTITTGPQLADQQVAESSVAVAQQKPRDNEESAPVVVPVTPEPNCYLDANGEIVCQ